MQIISQTKAEPNFRKKGHRARSLCDVQNDLIDLVRLEHPKDLRNLLYRKYTDETLESLLLVRILDMLSHRGQQAPRHSCGAC